MTTHGHLGARFRLKLHVLRATLPKFHRVLGAGVYWGDVTDTDGEV